MSELVLDEYVDLLHDLKARIRESQVRATLAVNSELVRLYWQVGHRIIEHQRDEGWGSGVIPRLSADLLREFPAMKGFSPRNLRYMRDFAREWPDEAIWQEVLAKLPWYHNITLIEKLSEPAERLWYAGQAIENAWSRNVLVHQIQSGLYQRQGQAITNFSRTLPSPQSDLAQQLLKDPYHFDFLMLGSAVRERDLERGLVTHLRDFLLELGVGFAFVGSQYRLEVEGEEYYTDLLFYHVRLHCYVVIELKTGKFQPEHAGKMNFYLSAVDDLLRSPADGPSIGIILCNERGRVTVEYALRDANKPIGVSTYVLTAELPVLLQGSLPTVEELESALEGA